MGRYDRQISLIGEKDQEKIERGSAMVLGLGGLGSFVAHALAASGLKTLITIDFDEVSLENLHRQYLFSTEDIGSPKAAVLGSKIKAIRPDINLIEINGYFDADIAMQYFPQVDVIVDCLDHMPSKYIANDYAVLMEKPLVYGSLYKDEAYISFFNNAESKANLRDYFPAAQHEDRLTCSQVGILSPVVNLCASVQVDQVLSFFCQMKNRLLETEMLIYNLSRKDQFKLKPSKRSFDKIKIQELLADQSIEMTWEETVESGRQLATFLKETEVPKELRGQTVFLDDQMDAFPSDLALFCKRGVSSLKKVESVGKRLNWVSIKGGLQLWTA